MHHEGYDQWLKFGKNLTAPITEWNKAATDICRKITQENLDIIGENFSRLSDQFKRLSNVKRPEDFISLQKDCLNEDVSAAIENTQKLIHLSMENMEEITKLCGTVRETALSAAAKMEKGEKEKSGK